MTAQENTPETQCGFRSNRGTVDMIFMLRQTQEKCREQNTGLYAAFVDLTKAYGTVNRDGLWKILARLGCPSKFHNILRKLHEGQQRSGKAQWVSRTASPSPTASSRDAFWPPHCSPSSSTLCSVRQTRTCQTASTSVSEQTAVSSTFGVSSHARKPSRN